MFFEISLVWRKNMTNTLQWMQLDFGPFERLEKRLHANGQLFLQPPPNDLSVATRCALVMNLSN